MNFISKDILKNEFFQPVLLFVMFIVSYFFKDVFKQVEYWSNYFLLLSTHLTLLILDKYFTEGQILSWAFVIGVITYDVFQKKMGMSLKFFLKQVNIYISLLYVYFPMKFFSKEFDNMRYYLLLIVVKMLINAVLKGFKKENDEKKIDEKEKAE